MFVSACVIIYLRDLGFCNFEGKNTTDALTPGVYMQHDLGGPIVIHGEKGLNDIDDKVHRCKVVIQQHNFVHRRWLDLGSRLFKRDAAILIGFIFITHGAIVVHLLLYVELSIQQLTFFILTPSN